MNDKTPLTSIMSLVTVEGGVIAISLCIKKLSSINCIFYQHLYLHKMFFHGEIEKNLGVIFIFPYISLCR